MARIGGRNRWIAVPAALLCAAVVGSLVWLSLPMVPVTIAWVGDTLRKATAPQPEATPAEIPARIAADGGAVDCRTIYGDDLWNELLWRPGSLLNQTMAPPPTAATAFADAATPEVVVTCAWRFDAGGIVTTLSKVDAAAASVAAAALGGEGFSCEESPAATVCSRTRAGVREEHTVRDGLWLSSVETRWHPEDYGARLDHEVWG
ncbi:hypothetical protein ACFT30_13220 [Microbacterium ureisolvens]|uniref:hypothetical protein n=1 Tax=Microbacterium ureisolvens TaxID=2781186 RepID=UPI00363E8E24